MKNSVITRFAPSPTGLLHAGNYRTAVFAYLFAKQSGGAFIVRIEDTDKERSKKEYEQNILKTLEWLGLQPDEVFHQSTHVVRHTEMLKKLITAERAYVAEEGVIRFRNPNIKLTFADAIRGPITFDTTELHDFVIARSIESPLFHLAVVVDDADEGVSHVIRGEDHISNTPRQILIQEALGLPTPVYVHLPLVLAPDRTKLSKRNGAKPLLTYKEGGYLPEAVLNCLALTGWHPEGEKEIFSIGELVEVFDLKRIQKGGGIYDETKLRWFNHEHIKKLSDDTFASRLTQYVGKVIDARLTTLLKERYQTLGEIKEALEGGEYDFLESISYPTELLTKGAKTDTEQVKKHLTVAYELLQKLPHEEFTGEKAKEVLFPYATEVGRAGVLWPLRVALSGKEKSPDPFTLAALLGKKETLRRIEKALKIL